MGKWIPDSMLVEDTQPQMPFYIYMLQAIDEAVDSGDSAARIFFADFSKGFDLIDHNILITKLTNL